MTFHFLTGKPWMQEWHEGIGWSKSGWRGIPKRLRRRVWNALRAPFEFAELRAEVRQLESDLDLLYGEVLDLRSELTDLKDSTEGEPEYDRDFARTRGY
jgi:hypothetical protein